MKFTFEFRCYFDWLGNLLALYVFWMRNLNFIDVLSGQFRAKTIENFRRRYKENWAEKVLPNIRSKWTGIRLTVCLFYNTLVLNSRSKSNLFLDWQIKWIILEEFRKTNFLCKINIGLVRSWQQAFVDLTFWGTKLNIIIEVKEILVFRLKVSRNFKELIYEHTWNY